MAALGKLQIGFSRNVRSLDLERQGIISVTPVISSGVAYAVGDALGPLMTFANAAKLNRHGGVVTAINLLAKDQTDLIDMDLFIWHESVTTVADNDPISFSDADAAKLAGFVKFRSTDYIVAAALNSMAFKEVAIPYRCVSGSADIFGQLVIREIHTFGAVDEIVVALSVERD